MSGVHTTSSATPLRLHSVLGVLTAYEVDRTRSDDALSQHVTFGSKNNFAYFDTISISGHNVAMVGKGKPGPKGKGRARNISAQKPPPKPTNEDADVESEGKSASITKTSESPGFAIETCSQPNIKKAKVITNLNLNIFRKESLTRSSTMI